MSETIDAWRGGRGAWLVLMVGLLVGTTARSAHAQARCGGQDERACCVGERSAGACDAGLHETAGCSGDCRCAHSIFSSSGTCRLDVPITHCGRNGERACCLGERSGGACDAGQHEEAGCHGDCRCNRSLVSSSGTCRPDFQPTPCGRAGQRACCIGERPQGSCDPGLYEQPGAPAGDNRCRGGAARSSGTCIAPTRCGGEGQRACCIGERPQGSCDPGLYERAGAPAGDNRCQGGAASSSGTCVRFSHCGGEGERACCVGERSAPCDADLTEVPGGVPANARCSNNLLSSSGHCRRLRPHFLGFTRGDCSYLGLREWTGEFVDGDLGRCSATSADVGGVHFERPSRACRTGNFWIGLYGDFDVPDASCKTSFGPAFQTSCTDGKRVYHAYLLGVPQRELARAESLCRSTVGIVNNVQATPARCFSDGTGWQGEFIVADKACESKGSGDGTDPAGCPAGVVSVSQVAVQNQTRHDLSLWTKDLTAAQTDASVVPKLIKHLAPDERTTIQGDTLPASGHTFLLALLDVTAVEAFNRSRKESGSSSPPYGVDSTGADGAIYVYNFYAMDPLPLVACQHSAIGYSQETGEFFVTGPTRDVPPPPPPARPPGLTVGRPASAPSDQGSKRGPGCARCDGGGADGGFVLAVLAFAHSVRRRRRRPAPAAG